MSKQSGDSPVRSTSFIRSAIGGTLAAGSATVVFHPIDTIKTVLQRGASTVADTQLSTVKPRPQLVRAFNELGLRGLWRGVVPAGISMSAACAVRMGAYEVIKDNLLRSESSLAPAALVASASAASVVVSAGVRAPLDMIKTQLQAGSSTGLVAAIKQAWGSGGIAGLYRGAGLALMRDVPFFSLNLMLYEQLRQSVRHRRAQQFGHQSDTFQELSPSEAIFTGAIAQGVAGWTTNPIDVLKTRVQASSATGQPITVPQALRSVLKEGGVLGLMRGAMMRTIWIAPQGMVYYPVYEWVQQSKIGAGY